MNLHIVDSSCTACGNRRTADFSNWGLHCFNCGRTRPAAEPGLARRVIAADEWQVKLLSEGRTATGTSAEQRSPLVGAH